MNKQKIGKYLTNLRKNKNWSQRILSEKLEEYSGYISTDAISQWEKGDTIPTIDNLLALSELYEVTIDDILDGETYKEIDLSQKYFISNDHWSDKYKGDSKVDYYGIRQEQLYLVKENFEKLLRKRVEDDFTRLEEREFRFLFENFYLLTDYYKNYLDIKNTNIENMHYSILMKAIYNCLREINDMSNEEKVWEIRKMIIPIYNTSFEFQQIADSVPTKDSITDKRFNQLDFWEKDMILATIQNCDPIIIEEDKYGSRNLERYKKLTGKEYNADNISKEIIKYLINNGACINTNYLNFYEFYNIEKRYIDDLERYYNLCKKPLKIYVGNYPNVKYYNVENTFKNRFVLNYYYILKHQFKKFNFDELFDLFKNNEVIPFEVLKQMLKDDGVDVNKNEEYIKADINSYYQYLLDKWGEFKNKEKEIEIGLIEIPKLEEKIKNNINTYNVEQKIEVGEHEPKKIRDKCYEWNQFVTYDEIKKLRKPELTQELFQNIDSMTLEEIRNKYFKKEEIHNNED